MPCSTIVSAATMPVWIARLIPFPLNGRIHPVASPTTRYRSPVVPRAGFPGNFPRYTSWPSRASGGRGSRTTASGRKAKMSSTGGGPPGHVHDDVVPLGGDRAEIQVGDPRGKKVGVDDAAEHLLDEGAVRGDLHHEGVHVFARPAVPAAGGHL